MKNKQPVIDLSAALSPGHRTIPRADWDRAPWNRWTFSNISQMTPVAPIARGQRPVREFIDAPVDIAGITFELDGQTRSVEDLFGTLETDGIIVLKDGKRIAEHYYGDFRADSLHLSQSLAKSVTGTVAGILAGRGDIDVEAPLTDYLPDLAKTGYKGATLRHVLDMTSGVTFTEDYTALDSHMAIMDHACGWKDAGADGWPSTIWELILSLKDTERPHGAHFYYRSIETDVLAFALQAATGKSIAQLISEEIWQKIGAAHDASITVDRAGYGLACGGFNATLSDYARFAQLWADHGLVDGVRVLPDAWITDTLAGNPAIFDSQYRYVLPHGAYRNQFWIEKAGSPVIIGRGVFGQTIYIDLAVNFVCVVMSSWPDFVNPDRTRAVFAAIRAIRQAL